MCTEVRWWTARPLHPVDLLEHQEADTLARWLAAREGIEVICRDRAGAYASAASAAAPDAIQIADRWPVWKNLCDTVEKAIGAHRGCLDPPNEPRPAPVEGTRPEGIQTAQTRRRHAEVHALYDTGDGMASTASPPKSAWTVDRTPLRPSRNC
ncbi:transposase [Streptomyces sp. NBC_00212]|uniref:transposase n=1 Tax=Streptomyces sp. NBC_00212 TaxID=2975684 RepID=UPI003245C57E